MAGIESSIERKVPIAERIVVRRSWIYIELSYFARGMFGLFVVRKACARSGAYIREFPRISGRRGVRREIGRTNTEPSEFSGSLAAMGAGIGVDRRGHLL